MERGAGLNCSISYQIFQNLPWAVFFSREWNWAVHAACQNVTFNPFSQEWIHPLSNNMKVSSKNVSQWPVDLNTAEHSTHCLFPPPWDEREVGELLISTAMCKTVFHCSTTMVKNKSMPPDKNLRLDSGLPAESSGPRDFTALLTFKTFLYEAASSKQICFSLHYKH